MIRVTDRDLTALSYIAARLRPQDAAEVFACAYDPSPERLAMDTFNCGEFQWVWWWNNVPVASMGAHPVWPGVWQVWAFGTQGWRHVVRDMTRHARRTIIPGMRAAGAHRAQCYSHADHVQSHRWLEMLGAEREATLSGFGSKGEDFVVYAMRF